jgi:hypothetical protein
VRAWLTATGSNMKPGHFSLIPSTDGRLQAVVAWIKSADDLWALGNLSDMLPAGDYALHAAFTAKQLERLTLGVGTGCVPVYPLQRDQTGRRAAGPESCL